MTTPLERSLRRQQQLDESGMILVPILEQLLERPVEPEDDDDFRFLDMLVRARAIPRAKGVFSPSMLGSCMRQAYFAKTGVEKQSVESPRTYGYFLTGNFTHLKWQFALWKGHRAGLLKLATVPAESLSVDFYGDGTRPAVEVRVVSESGDYAGTVDAIADIIAEHYIVDFKGLNLIDFQRQSTKPKHEYCVQIVGYAMIVNGTHKLPFAIKKCLLVTEAKPGPIQGQSPIALHETLVLVDDHKDEVRARLNTLRSHVAKESVPPPSCVSTRHIGFQECPFNRYCRDEVKVVQRKREEKARRSKRPFRVAKGQRRED